MSKIQSRSLSQNRRLAVQGVEFEPFVKRQPLSKVEELKQRLEADPHAHLDNEQCRKLLEMIVVLRQPLREIRDRLQVASVSHQMAVVGLARADEIERSLG